MQSSRSACKLSRNGPKLVEKMAHDAAILLSQGSFQSGLQVAGDGGKHLSDLCGQRAQACDRSDGDKGDYQGVFDQILTFFTVHQVLELQVHFQQHGIHLDPLRRLNFPASGRVTLLNASGVPFFYINYLSYISTTYNIQALYA